MKREIWIEKEKFVLLSQKKKNEEWINEEKSRKEENKYEKKKFVAIRLGVQRINLR